MTKSDKVEYKRPINLYKYFGGKINYKHMPRGIYRDNKDDYNYGSGGDTHSIRVPSLKRSDKVWKNFYKLFPFLKGLKTYKGLKLKKI